MPKKKAVTDNERAIKLKQYEELVRKETELLAKMKSYRDDNLIEFFDKAPSPGPNPRQAEILESWLDPHYKTYTFTGGNRMGKCLISSTYVDTTKGKVKVGDLFEDGKSFQVYAWDGAHKVVADASAPFKKSGLHQCYELQMSDGQILGLADRHRILTSHGWLSIEDVLCICSSNLLDSNLERGPLVHALNGRHLTERPLGFQDYYSGGFYQCDEPFRFGLGIFQEYVPSQDDFLTHNHSWLRRDDLDNIRINIPYEALYPLSNQYVSDRGEGQFAEFLSHSDDKILSSSLLGYQLSLKPSSAGVFELRLDPVTVEHQFPVSSLCVTPLYVIGDNNIDNITIIPTYQEIYDFEVKKYHNYFAGGIVHHNTTLDVLLAFSTMFGHYPWNKTNLLHLFNHNHPRKVRYIGQDWEKHIKSVVIPELEKWWPKSRPVQKKKNNVGIDSLWVDEKTKSSLEIMSNGQESELHEGWSGDLVVYDEPPKRDIRIANARGLVDRLGRELFCMTLLKEAWVDREVIKATLPNGKPDDRIFSVHGTSYDNVGYGITKEGLEIFSSKLTPEERESRLHGVPSYMSGLVYPSFVRRTHLMERFQVPLDWMVDIAIDVHPREKQAVLFVATDPRGDRYVVEEIWGHGDSKWIAEAIIRACKYSAYRVHRIVIDPLAKGDSNNAESIYEQVSRMLLPQGYVLETATKDKEQGILEVKKHLTGPNRKPSLFFFNDLVRTIYEIEGYMWDEDKQKPCVIGDTLIDTPTGNHRIRDLIGKELLVYGYSHDKGRIDVAKAVNIRKTGKRKEIWKLTMDRGVLFATPDHLVMLRNGDYRQVSDLRSYESLMPLYRTIAVDGYSRINPNDYRSKRGGTYPSEHRFVWECLKGPITDNMQIHHKDFNYLNNDIDNLQLIDPSEHQRIHMGHECGNVVCIFCGQSFSQQRPWQRHCSKECRESYNYLRRKSLVEKTFKVSCATCGLEFETNNHRHRYCSINCREIGYRNARIPRTRRQTTAYNHKVLSSEFYGYEDVYDMNVEGTSNFVANGIVVHNCDKDDHMMENLYRILLLNTKYFEQEEQVDDRLPVHLTEGRDSMTGY